MDVADWLETQFDDRRGGAWGGVGNSGVEWSVVLRRQTPNSYIRMLALFESIFIIDDSFIIEERTAVTSSKSPQLA